MSQRSTQSSTPSQALPLQGICVADFSRVVAGPYCTMLLADMGADVIKVEHPTRGDDTRAWGPPYASSSDEASENPQESAYFLSINRNKRSLRLDLKSEQGQALAGALIRRADVLVHNFQADTASSLGLDVDNAKAINPQLIYATISSYGSSGPLADEPGYDLLAQAATGLMSITGPPNGEPHKVGVAMVDVLAGLNAAYGIVAALFERAQTGHVRQVETSLFEAGLAGLINVASNALIGGQTPPRLGNAHPNIVPYQTFITADEPIAIAVGNDGQFASFAKLLNKPDWADDARFQTNTARVIHRDELIPQISEIIQTRSQQAWLEALSKANIPAAPVATVDDALNSAQAQARAMVQEIVHPSLGHVPLVSSGLKLDGQPTPIYRHPPRLGEHDDELLAELLKDVDNIHDVSNDSLID
ncbi:MAG: CoA transferase [Deinococcota bacterium]